ncbi:hypothetical protein QBC34DRAFT_461985 [Podospora aff. communis PSN243]|uniref:Uncharacterized protein n=1 Tax=Podospora aff. communis PSN243 TaxID=3040156 RepID=A0AAV9GSH5_9PEZI|nr:hypothetical protein QBC34DRAFT_461985 [Podospora aff. communis PSN243]
MPMPHIVVAVDVGYLTTTVAWTEARPAADSEWTLKRIPDWPGAPDPSINHVPTTVRYDAEGKLLSWGYGCSISQPGEEVSGWADWHPVLNSSKPADKFSRAKRRDTEKRLADFLGHVHDRIAMHIADFLCPSERVWWETRIDSVFARPAGDPLRMKRAIVEAGFETGSEHHRVIVGSLRGRVPDSKFAVVNDLIRARLRSLGNSERRVDRLVLTPTLVLSDYTVSSDPEPEAEEIEVSGEESGEGFGEESGQGDDGELEECDDEDSDEMECEISEEDEGEEDEGEEVDEMECEASEEDEGKG